MVRKNPEKVDIAAGNPHLQFMVEIWTNNEDQTLVAKKDKVKIHKSDEFPFLDMKMS